MSKSCIVCGKSKSFSEFAEGKNQCKSCKVQYVHERRKTKKAENTSIASDIKHMKEQITKAMSVLDDVESMRDRYSELSKIIREMYRLNELTAEGILMELKLNVPQQLHDYLVQLQGGDSNTNFSVINMARTYLTDTRYEHGFKDHFGIERETLLQYLPLLSDMHNILGFIKCAYLALVDTYISKANSKFVPISEHEIDSSFLTNVFIRFDGEGDCIVADGNPLRLDRATFLSELDKLIHAENFNVTMYHKAGYYDKFKALLLSD